MAAFLQRNRKRLWAFAIFVVVSVGAAAIILPGARGGRCKEISPKNACINNLRQIDGAKEQWALEHKKEEGDVIIISEIDQYIKGGHPTCPTGGKYRYRKVGDAPQCSVKDHTIE